MNLCLSNEKCLMLSDQGIVLDRHISSKGIEVDPKKVKIYLIFQVPKSRNVLRASLDMWDITDDSLKISAKYNLPCSPC
jgi:hypothetical protein